MTGPMNHHGGGGATLTRLGRAVRTVHGTADPDAPHHRKEHRQVNWLRDVILGGQDGLVNILGVIADGGSRVVLLAAGFSRPVPRHVRPDRRKQAGT